MKLVMCKKAFIILSIVALMLAAACSLTSIGGIRKSRDVTQQFEKFESQPNHRYWYLNQENSPYGIAGLDREYRLDAGPVWREIDPDSAAFRKVVGLVQSFPLPGSYTSGFAIMDAQGRQIGVWYSSLSAGITVDPHSKIVSISTALPWLFDERY
jgi:hypothetical protein